MLIGSLQCARQCVGYWTYNCEQIGSLKAYSCQKKRETGKQVNSPPFTQASSGIPLEVSFGQKPELFKSLNPLGRCL